MVLLTGYFYAVVAERKLNHVLFGQTNLHRCSYTRENNGHLESERRLEKPVQ